MTHQQESKIASNAQLRRKCWTSFLSNGHIMGWLSYGHIMGWLSYGHIMGWLSYGHIMGWLSYGHIMGWLWKIAILFRQLIFTNINLSI